MHTLYVAGHFDSIGGVISQNVIKWDGSSWIPLVNPRTYNTGNVYQVLPVEEAGEFVVYAAGSFGNIDNVAARNVARRDHLGWHALGSGLNWLTSCLAEFDDGNGQAIYAGGSFSASGETGAWPEFYPACAPSIPGLWPEYSGAGWWDLLRRSTGVPLCMYIT